MLIWDTGEYEVLPYHSNNSHEPETSSDDGDDNHHDGGEDTMIGTDPWQDHIRDNKHPRSSWSAMSEQEKLHQSFQNRKLRLRLHGTRLPPNYTVTLRLSSSAPDFPPPTGSTSFSRKRKRSRATATPRTTSPTSDIDDEHETAMLDTEETQRRSAQDEETRHANAYPDASNTIGSVHQRTWYLSLDRVSSGFVRVRSADDGGGRQQRVTQWARTTPRQRRGEGDHAGKRAGFEPFHVLGRDVERSVVTGRTAAELMKDEGVEGFVSRRGWKGKV